MVPKSSPRLTALAGVVFLAVAAPAAASSLSQFSKEGAPGADRVEERRDETPAIVD